MRRGGRGEACIGGGWDGRRRTAAVAGSIEVWTGLGGGHEITGFIVDGMAWYLYFRSAEKSR
jgi:hypothetical protein